MKAKTTALDLEKFPRIKGAHECQVKHPSEVKPDQWPTLSLELKAKFYARYLEYIKNWNAAHKPMASKAIGSKFGKGMALKLIGEPDEDTAQLNESWNAEMAKLFADPDADEHSA